MVIVPIHLTPLKHATTFAPTFFALNKELDFWISFC